MKRITRTAAVAGIAKASDLWRTPWPLFATLHAEFDFDVDLAADASNHLHRCWFGPGGDAPDALALSSWVNWGLLTGFLNPPYSSALIKPFMAKAAAEARKGFTTVALVPYSPDTQWWQATAGATEIREIPHRVPFIKVDATKKPGAMFPSAVVVFRPQPGVIRGEPRRVVWTYREAK